MVAVTEPILSDRKQTATASGLGMWAIRYMRFRVNAIAPGMFRTRMTEAVLERAESFVAGSTPMGRIGKPGELAPAVLFLASEGASYITGQVIAIDGGRSAQ